MVVARKSVKNYQVNEALHMVQNPELVAETHCFYVAGVAREREDMLLGIGKRPATYNPVTHLFIDTWHRLGAKITNQHIYIHSV